MNESSCFVLLSRLNHTEQTCIQNRNFFTTDAADMAIGQTKALVVNGNTECSEFCGHFCALGCYSGMALTHTTLKHEPSDLNPARTSSWREKTNNTL